MGFINFLFPMENKLKMELPLEVNTNKNCCFSGHRDVSAESALQLSQRLMNGVTYLHDNNGISTFLTGGALGFDTLAAEAVIECKKGNPDIRLVLVLPCADQAAHWSQAAVKRYNTIKRQADKVICLADHYYDGCMFARNRYMVDHSSACICYLTKTTGGTAYTVRYAHTRGLRIYNIARK